MNDRTIFYITDLPENVYPITPMMNGYIVNYWQETGKSPGSFPNLETGNNRIKYYVQAKEYYQKAAAKYK